MSHNNYDKPFYVDVGPITTAIRCQTNDDALILHDYVHGGHSLIDTANNMCGRMNEEVDEFVAAKDEEIAKLRKLVEGLLDFATIECARSTCDCGSYRECIIRDAIKYIEKCEVG